MIRSMPHRLLLVLTVLLVQTVANAQGTLTADQEQRITRFIEQAMDSIDMVPGLGIAIVQNGTIAYSAGFGLRDVERKLPVTKETGFYIASTTKTITGLAAAQLEQQKMLSLDAPLSTYYPDLDPMIHAEQVKLTDLLSHDHTLDNSGIQFRLAYVDEIHPEDFRRLVRDFSTPRERKFEYSNLAYNLMGDIMERVTGKSWKEVNAEEVLGPLGMKHTTASMSVAQQHELALPYMQVNDAPMRLPLKVDGQMQSAGGYVTTPEDLARLVMVIINKGKLDGKQVVPAAVIERMTRKYASQDREYAGFSRTGYGLGLQFGEFRGQRQFHHFGSFEGAMAHMSMLPDQGWGVVALANEDAYGGVLPHLVASYVYDLLLGTKDLTATYDSLLSTSRQRMKEQYTKWSGRLKQKEGMMAKAGSDPNGWGLAPELAIGTYYNTRLGSFDVLADAQGRLFAQWGPHRAEMLPAQKDVLLVDWRLTGLLTPPVQLDVRYAENKEIAAMNYEDREFRKLPAGLSPQALRERHREFQKALDGTASLADAQAGEKLPKIFAEHYPLFVIDEGYLNALGYRYLRSGRTASAIATFNTAVEKYPHSANAYDSLGEAFLKKGDKEQALVNYRRSVELDPGNTHGKEVIAELEK